MPAWLTDSKFWNSTVLSIQIRLTSLIPGGTGMAASRIGLQLKS
jgi:hypothetical protein